MKEKYKDYTKDNLGEKLRRHTMDIIMISMMACLFAYFVTHKQPAKGTVQDIKQTKIVNVADTLNTKTR
jgi:hypothetical protein